MTKWKRCWDIDKPAHMWELAENEAVHIDWHGSEYRIVWELADEHDRVVAHKDLGTGRSVKACKAVAEDWVRVSRDQVLQEELKALLNCAQVVACAMEVQS